MSTDSPVCDWFDPFVEPALTEPAPAWERLRDEQPVFYSPVVGGWLVTRYADALSVLGDPAHFSNSAMSTAGRERPAAVQAVLDQIPDPLEMDVVVSDPPRHSRLRKFMQSAFTPRRVASMRDDVVAIADGLIDLMIDEGRCDIYERFAYPFPLLVVCRLLGVPTEMAPDLNEWSTASLAVRFGVFSDEESHLAAARGRVSLYRFAESVIQDRTDHPRDDLVSQIVQESGGSDDPLTRPELVHQVIALISAGHETSANGLTLGLYHLLANRDQWQRILDDISVLETAVDEMLRFASPMNTIWRRAIADVEVAGVTIPAGDRVGLLVASANRDESVFECPADLDVARANADRHLNFGRGIHFCVGAGLARQELRVALQQLSTRLPSLRLQENASLGIRPNAVLRIPSGLAVEWDERGAAT